jgi:ABC-2 type transport system ATP-binding protein
VRAQAAAGRAVLISSHLLAEVAQSVDDVVIIAGGELRARGPLAQVLGGDEGTSTEVAARDADGLARALRGHGHQVQPAGDKLLVLGVTPRQVGDIASEAQIALWHLAPRARSLEAAFFELTAARA